MKQTIKKSFCTLLAVVLLLTAAPLAGFVGMDLSSQPGILTAQAATITSYKTGDIIEFGWYPQSEVTDSATIDALNAEDGDWLSYEYYKGTTNNGSLIGGYHFQRDYAHGKMTASDFMRYKDVTYGDNKYRAVIFDSYRPYNTAFVSSKNQQSSNGYSPATVYWFKYEPIRWRVLDPSTGLVLSENILDSQAFQNYLYYAANSSGTNAYWGDAEKTFYSTNYEKSSIRQWLNDDFYNTAFSTAQQNIIVTKRINGEENKIYLLSSNDVVNTSYGFSSESGKSDAARKAQGTAYAKCQGLYVDDSYSMWMLRTSSPDLSGHVVRVSDTGNRWDAGDAVNDTNSGTRPAFNFDVTADIFQSDILNMDGSANATAEKYTETEIDTLVLKTRNIQSWLSLNDKSMDNSAELNWKMDNSTARIGEKTFEQDKKKEITVSKDDVTADIILSHEDYYNYIIPKSVAESYMGMGVTNVAKHTAYMRKEIKNGKPYVSTVFAREDGTQNTYVELQKEELVVSSGRTYAFSITADNLNEMATYYISQDEAHKIESLFGTFTTDQLKANLQDGQDTYVYFKTASGVVSDPVKINIKFEEPQSNRVVMDLTDGKFNIGGEEGLSLTFPEEWILVGGSTLDLREWTFPCGVQLEGDEVRVSVGLDLFTKETTKDKAYISTENGDIVHEYEPEIETSSILTKEYWTKFKEELIKGEDSYKKAKEKGEAIKKKKKELCEKYGIKADDIKAINSSKTKMSVTSLGYIEGRIVNGRFIVTEMLLSIGGSITISYTAQLSVGYIGIEGGGKLTVATTWSRATADLNLPLEFGVVVDAIPEIKARGGAGWDGIASAGVYGKASMPIKIEFKDKKLSLSIKGEFGVEGQVLIWSTGEQKILSGTFGPKEFFFGKSSVERARTLQAHGLTTEDVGSAQTVYSLTERKQSSAWLGDDRLILNNGTNTPNRVGVSAAEELTFKTLQQDVFELSEAKIITAGDTTIAVWITEAAERDDYNRLTLVYSLYDVLTDTWSEPKAVYDDGFMDATPVLATDGEKIFVAWQKYCKTFTAENSANIADVLAAADIYVAEYDILNDAFVNATRITEDSVYDYRTALTVKDGEVVVVYATASDNTLMSATNNNITKVENGSKEVLVQNISTVNNLACVVIDNAVEIAYSADADGDLQTTEDIGVFYGTDTFAQFPKYYENDTLANLVYADFNGKTTLFVSDGVNIYYADKGEAVALMEKENIISSQLQAVNTTDGLSFYWLASESSGAVKLYTCSYADGSWSNAVCLSEDERNTELSNLAVASVYGQVLGVYNEKLYDFIGTSDGISDVALITNFVFFKENDCFDLAMISAELDEGDWNWGDTAFIAVEAENLGNVKADSLIFTVSDSNGLQKNYLVDEQLLPGQSVLWYIPYGIPNNIAETTVTVSVSDNIHADCNTDNDAVDFNAEQASLLVASNNIEYLGRAYVLSADITNTNFAKAEKVMVEVCFEDPESEPVSSYYVGELAKDELAVVEFAFTEKDFVFDENGTAVVYFVVNAENATHVISSFVVREAPDTYIIDSKEELLSFASEVNGGYSFAGKVIRLENDIDLSDVDWVAIGDGSNPFSGVFDGNNYSITGLNYKNDSAVYAGLFGYIKNGGVKNLTVQGSVIGANRVGMIAGYMLDSALYNCKAEGAVARTGSGLYAYVGGLVGSALHSVIINCAVETDISVAFDAEINYAAVGGIAGVASAGSSEPMCILNSYCAGDITVSGNSFSSTAMGSAQYYVGGIAGYLRDDAVNNYYYGSIIDAEEEIDTEEELIKDIGYAFGYVWPEFTATGDYNGVGTIIVKHNYYPEGKNAIGAIEEGTYDSTEWTESVSDYNVSLLDGDDSLIGKLNSNKAMVEEIIVQHRDILSDGTWAELVDRIEGESFTVASWQMSSAKLPVNYRYECVEHEESDWVIDVDASCEDDGTKHTYCLVCNEIINTETIDKLGHVYVGVVTTDPTCTESGVKIFTCTNDATHTYTEEIPALGHCEEVIPAVDATCTATGLTEGKKCSACGEVLVEQIETPVLGHTEEILPALAPTCTTSGLTEGKKCTVCGEVTIEQTVVSSLGHTEEVIPGKAATCTATGLTEGKKCTVCGETTLAQTEIAKLAHSKVTVNQKAATATENGYTGDVVCSVCGTEISKGKVIPATGDAGKNCDHICHKDGFIGFIWKIVQFFWRLFGMNPVCECGAAHY